MTRRRASGRKTGTSSARGVKAIPRQAEIEWTPYTLSELAEGVRKERFPDLGETPRCCFVPCLPMACITQPGAGRPNAEAAHKAAEGYFPPYISINPIFNHPETPRLVLEFVVSHEMLHLLFPAAEENGHIVQHSKEFRKREEELCPEMELAWK